jgi:hypothetical protein
MKARLKSSPTLINSQVFHEQSLPVPQNHFCLSDSQSPRAQPSTNQPRPRRNNQRAKYLCLLIEKKSSKAMLAERFLFLLLSPSRSGSVIELKCNYIEFFIITWWRGSGSKTVKTKKKSFLSFRLFMFITRSSEAV